MTLYVKQTGPADAPTIIFLHGGGASGWLWEAPTTQLSDYHCLVVDMPEHGQSIDEKPFSIEDTAARIAGIIRSHVRGGKAHVVGLSLGAQTIVKLLSMAPEVVDHAVISGTLVRPLPGAWMLGAVGAMYMPFRNMEFLVKANMKSLGVPEKYLEQFREDTRLLTTESFVHITGENMKFKLPAGLDRVTAPVLVLVGEKEQGIMRQSAHDLLKALPNAQGRIAPKVGHNWPLEAPELFIETVRAWIEDKPLSPVLLPL